MRRSRLLVVLALASGASVWACNGLIGEHEIFYEDPDSLGPTSSQEGGSDTSRSGDALVSPDTGPCGDTMASGDNCGTCGHSCLGGKCEMGLCQPVALASNLSARDLRIDKDHVYWIEPLTAHAQQTDLDGKNLVTLGGGTSNFLVGLAIDEANAYWGSRDAIILRCKLGGCGASPTTVTAQAPIIYSLAVDATNAYWIGEDTNSKVALFRTPKGGANGAAITLATSTAATKDFNKLATDGINVYFSADDGMIRRVPVAGGTVTVIGKSVGEADNLVLDENNVYWSVGDPNTGTINMAAKDGSTPNLGTILTGSQDLPLGLAVDQTNLYWVNGGSALGGNTGTIMTCTLGSCTPKALAKGQLTPFSVAVDAKAIYWTNYALGNPTGSIMRLAR